MSCLRRKFENKLNIEGAGGSSGQKKASFIVLALNDTDFMDSQWARGVCMSLGLVGLEKKKLKSFVKKI